jgi:hypothetical protein
MGKNICPACINDMDTYFVKVRDYLDDNPNAGIDIVSEETEVPKGAILQLIKEERIIFNEGVTGAVISCEICKKSILVGRICNKCKANLNSMIDKQPKSTGSGSNNSDNIKGSAKISS